MTYQYLAEAGVIQADKRVPGGEGSRLTLVVGATLFEVAQAAFNLPDSFSAVAQIFETLEAQAGVVVGYASAGVVCHAISCASGFGGFQAAADETVDGYIGVGGERNGEQGCNQCG